MEKITLRIPSTIEWTAETEADDGGKMWVTLDPATGAIEVIGGGTTRGDAAVLRDLLSSALAYPWGTDFDGAADRDDVEDATDDPAVIVRGGGRWTVLARATAGDCARDLTIARGLWVTPATGDGSTGVTGPIQDVFHSALIRDKVLFRGLAGARLEVATTDEVLILEPFPSPGDV